MALTRGVAATIQVLCEGAAPPVAGSIVGGAALSAAPSRVGETDWYDVALTAEEMDAESFGLSLIDAVGAEFGFTVVPEDLTTERLAKLDGAAQEATLEAIAEAVADSDPLANPVPGSYASGSAGYVLGRVQSNTVESWTLVTHATLDTSAVALGPVTVNSVPTAGVVVTAYASTDTSRTTPIASDVTDGSGYFSFYLDSGSYVIVAAYAGVTFPERTVTVP